MLEQLTLPVLAAIATLIAAGIGAVVAIVVALVNAWSARRIAIDDAHRAHRKELAEPIVAETRMLMRQLYELHGLACRMNDQEMATRALLTRALAQQRP